jgi:Cell division protein
MKAFKTLFRSIRDAFKSVGRNFSLSLASISCITITLIIIGAALMISQNVSNFTKEIEKDLTIVAFLNSDITDENRDSFEKELKNIENIESYTFKSKAEVKTEMEKENTALSEILGSWSDEENPLRDAYTIKVNSVEAIGKTAGIIEKLEGVSVVQYGEGLAEKLVKVFDSVEKVTIIAAVALVIVTVFLIINTIKLTIFSRRTEISIMRLVGASNTRIRMPFVFEGIILGTLGAIIPIILIVYGYNGLYSRFDGQLFSPVIKLIKPMPFILYASGIVLMVGILVGMIGSGRAVRKYLNK